MLMLLLFLFISVLIIYIVVSRRKNKVNSEKKYEEKAKAMHSTAKESFDKTKLETDEDMQIVVSSDVASVAISNKRAYFKGMYFGTNTNEESSDAVNLCDIKNVGMSKRLKRGFYKKIWIYALFILIIVFVNKHTYNSYQDAINSRDRAEQQSKSLHIQASEEHSNARTAYQYFTKSSTDYAAENAEKSYYDKRSEAEKKYSTFFIILFFSILLTIYFLFRIYSKISTLLVRVIMFDCDSKKLGIELNDNSDYEKIKNIVTIAHSNMKQSSKDVTQLLRQQNCKIDNLTELSRLLEQGVINQEEFTKLKDEVINNQ